MTGNTQKTTVGIISVFTILLLSLWAINVFALQEDLEESGDEGEVAQQPAGSQKISPLSDYMYKRDYQRYEEIRKETNAQKQVDLLAAFLKERPISRVLLYVATDYNAGINKLANNDATKKISMLESLWDLVPTDQEIKAEEIPVGVEEFRKTHLLPTRKLILTSMVAVYYQSKNYPKAAEVAERAYSVSPDKTLLQTLFDIYNKMGNEEKILAYGRKMLDAFPMNQPQGYTTALQLADIYIKKQNVNAAVDLFTKLMNVYGNSVPPNIPEANWNQTRIVAYTLMARDAYSKNNYEKAEKLFQTVLSFNSRLDEPYYYLGMCKWKAKDQPAAIVYFARCTVLNKDYAARANKYLEDLYKATYPNKPEGLPDVLKQARSDLGL